MTHQPADKEIKRKNMDTSLFIMKLQREEVHDDAAVVSALLAFIVTTFRTRWAARLRIVALRQQRAVYKQTVPQSHATTPAAE